MSGASHYIIPASASCGCGIGQYLVLQHAASATMCAILASPLWTHAQSSTLLRIRWHGRVCTMITVQAQPSCLICIAYLSSFSCSSATLRLLPWQ